MVRKDNGPGWLDLMFNEVPRAERRRKTIFAQDDSDSDEEVIVRKSRKSHKPAAAVVKEDGYEGDKDVDTSEDKIEVPVQTKKKKKKCANKNNQDGATVAKVNDKGADKSNVKNLTGKKGKPEKEVTISSPTPATADLSEAESSEGATTDSEDKPAENTEGGIKTEAAESINESSSTAAESTEAEPSTKEVENTTEAEASISEVEDTTKEETSARKAEVLASPAEATTEAAKPTMGSDSEAQQGNIGADDSKWLRFMDASIIKEKLAGKTWAEIGDIVKRGKKETQKRYNHLHKHAKKDGMSMGEMKEKIMDDAVDIALGTKEDDRNPNTEKTKSPEKNRSPETKSNSKDKDKKTASWEIGKMKKTALVFSSPSEDDKDDSTDSEEEREKHKHFVYHEVYGGLYPDKRNFEPDKFWTADDCKVLGILEARHNELKWKYIQADFFNATGRMVPVAIMKHKMGVTEG